jgi:hypothetical protein
MRLCFLVPSGLWPVNLEARIARSGKRDSLQKVESLKDQAKSKAFVDAIAENPLRFVVYLAVIIICALLFRRAVLWAGQLNAPKRRESRQLPYRPAGRCCHRQ